MGMEGEEEMMGGCRWIEGGGQLVCTESGRGLHLVLFVCFLVSRPCLPSFDPESFYVPSPTSSSSPLL
jgi:hypothetical protein